MLLLKGNQQHSQILGLPLFLAMTTNPFSIPILGADQSLACGGESPWAERSDVPAALFKQTFAFLELCDKSNARTLLRRIVERYPQSDVAEAAKKKFEELK